ncbi:MAG TPA: GNAT family N-acetyltransferase [Stackebrandtia sp.]|uniref:GNAT family N-acetyltransferase n=1 Tax=Stackebrandtia sp. TaxID=2023065 RepID=UPI002D5B9496|nr:GNAT family N-acetyltransferase [Stackebrandtia sp.]HZE41673.1 GNAT family N-acetyltransferase [Stackebrandtia sp.]
MTTIRAMTPQDADAVADIHAQGIATGNATFAPRPATWDDFDRDHHAGHRFVADTGHRVVGWAATSPTSTRDVYQGVVEVSVYVAQAARGRGVGHRLLTHLITDTETTGIWTLLAGIFPDNTASLTLHQAHGFRVIGVNERVGRDTTGRWRDVVRLERRSTTAGTD